jgi:hypothetical protein
MLRSIAPLALGIWVGVCLALSLTTATSVARQSDTASPEQQLADRYAPVAYLREQTEDCARPPEGGEPYLPVPVELVLDNPAIVLRDSDTGEVLATGPDAVDLATFGPDTYLDFPGDPLRPGCTYERDERAWMAERGLVPTIYAKIMFDEEEQRLALQYWFFYYYNDWNNTHEGDWEGIQIMWDEVTSVEQALEMPPSRVGYAQHGGGELADWGDDKIELEDETHPVVYPAAGAHATFYSNSVYLAWGEQGSGFGCDYSSPPSFRVPLDVVVVPNDPDPSGPFAWLTWEGRWGERKPSMFNGPTGPNLNARWLDPWEATANWRTFSIVVPTDFTFGPGMADTFCTITSGASRLLISTVLYPWAAIPGISFVVAVLWLTFRRARFLIVQARQLYRAHWPVFAGIGLIAIPIGFAFNALQLYLIEHQPLRNLIDWMDDTPGARLTTVLLLGGGQQAMMLLFIAPAVIQAVKDIRNGVEPSISRSFRLTWGRLPTIALTALLFLAGVALPLLVVIGFPLTVWLAVRWQFFAQVLVFDERRGPHDALAESARLVMGRWWQTLLAVLLFDLIATVPGLVVGFGLLALGGTAVGFANGASSLLYALAIPFAVVGVTVLFLRRRGESPTPATPDPEPSTSLADGVAGFHA